MQLSIATWLFFALLFWPTPTLARFPKIYICLSKNLRYDQDNCLKQLLPMLIVVFLIMVGLVPPAISVWASHRAERRIVERLDLVTDTGHYPVAWRRRDPDEHYIDGIGLVIGDITCQLNARSPHIRCAVNPMGPCKGCRSYEERSYEALDGLEVQ